MLDSMQCVSDSAISEYIDKFTELLEIAERPAVELLPSSCQNNAYDCGFCLVYTVHKILLMNDKKICRVVFNRRDIQAFRFQLLQYFLIWSSAVPKGPANGS